MKNFFITGDRGIGKSTIIKRIIDSVDLTLGGFVTQRELLGEIQSFSLISLRDGGLYPIAKTNRRTGEKDINIDCFRNEIPSFLERDLADRKLLVLDELGFMENDIVEFTSMIFRILDSKVLVLGVLKDYDCGFLNRIKERRDTLVISIDEHNRDEIVQEIVRKLLIAR